MNKLRVTSLLLYCVTFSAVAFAQESTGLKECGVAPGLLSLSQRARDCSQLPGSVVGIKDDDTGKRWNWILVARRMRPTALNDSEIQRDYYDVWQDLRSGHLWGDYLDERHTQKGAVRECGSDQGLKAGAGITERKFELPSAKDYEVAVKNGLVIVFPELQESPFLRVWTSDHDWDLHLPYPFIPFGYVFEGSNVGAGLSIIDYTNRENFYPARCIAK